MSEQMNPTQPTQQAAATPAAVDAKPPAQRAVSTVRKRTSC